MCGEPLKCSLQIYPSNFHITKVIIIIQILNFAHETFISSTEKSEEVWIGPTGQDEIYAPVSHL